MKRLASARSKKEKKRGKNLVARHNWPENDSTVNDDKKFVIAFCMLFSFSLSIFPLDFSSMLNFVLRVSFAKIPRLRRR